MAEKLQSDQLPLLWAHGFVAGFSGTTWFATDHSGVCYQAIVDDTNDEIYFETQYGREKFYFTADEVREKFPSR